MSNEQQIRKITRFWLPLCFTLLVFDAVLVGVGPGPIVPLRLVFLGVQVAITAGFLILRVHLKRRLK